MVDQSLPSGETGERVPVRTFMTTMMRWIYWTGGGNLSLSWLGGVVMEVKVEVEVEEEGGAGMRGFRRPAFVLCIERLPPSCLSFSSLSFPLSLSLRYDMRSIVSRMLARKRQGPSLNHQRAVKL